uniref:Epidermal growth factor receptor pathway substrate 15 n=1 Tax=Cyprinus carpio TaxID=7962 RepID=A0A8C1NXC5_CYPCA
YMIDKSVIVLCNMNVYYDFIWHTPYPSGSGRVGAADAALFLKRSGLTDLILGKVTSQFFVALRLVACAQNGLEVSLKSLNTAVPPPKFHDTSSPLQFGPVPTDCPWVVKAEEKLKFDAIFDSLSPVGGMLTGDKVKPVLLNSKLPVDVLGRVWELSDIDRDGMLDRDEFAVAMHLVYRALESEPVPMSLPATLIPPSKRKKLATPPVMPLLPSPAQHKERGSAHSGSKTLPAKPTPPQWVVSPAEKAKYDDLFTKTDSDMDGLVSGAEVRDIFLKTGLPSATLARIWELCDIGDIGKLSRDQFALALYLINQKLSKGVDPPQTLSLEMIPPSDRLTQQNNAATVQAADFSANKDVLKGPSTQTLSLSLSQDLQEEVQKGSEELSRLQAERQEVQEKLERLDEQKRSLEEQLKLIQQQCSQENQLIQSLQVEHSEQEQRIGDYEEELTRAREELLQLQEESRQLGEKVQSARDQLCPLEDAVKESHTQIARVSELFICFCSDPFTEDPFSKVDISDPFGGDPFKGTDPFAADNFFKQSSVGFPSGDPFGSSDPFSATTGPKELDPFTSRTSNAVTPDPFASGSGNIQDTDPFGSKIDSNGSDPFDSSINKNLFKEDTQSDVPPALPPKTGTPTRPPPPPPGKRSNIHRSESSESFQRRGLFKAQGSGEFSSLPAKDSVPDPFAPSSPHQAPRDPNQFASFDKYPTEEDMIEWAKRESEREERERVARLTQQEQEDLELAIALSKSELS